MRRTRTLALVAALVIVAVAAGCGGGTKPTERAEEPAAETTTVPPTSASTTASTAPQSDEEAVLAAYRGYWDTWLAANDPPDPNHPGLDEYYSEPARSRAIESIENRRHLGQAVRLPPAAHYAHWATLTNLGGTDAVVTDCSVDDGELIDRSTGKVLNNAVVTSKLVATLVLIDGQWKVSDVSVNEKWDGESGCASEPR